MHVVSQYDNELVDKLTTARMPWHDIHTAMVTGKKKRHVTANSSINVL